MDPKTYTLPALIATALSTDRSLFCRTYANEQQDQEKAELGRLIGDMIDDRIKARDTIMVLQTQIKNIQGSVGALRTEADRLLAASRGSDEEIVNAKEQDEIELG